MITRKLKITAIACLGLLMACGRPVQDLVPVQVAVTKVLSPFFGDHEYLMHSTESCTKISSIEGYNPKLSDYNPSRFRISATEIQIVGRYYCGSGYSRNLTASFPITAIKDGQIDYQKGTLEFESCPSPDKTPDARYQEWLVSAPKSRFAVSDSRLEITDPVSGRCLILKK